MSAGAIAGAVACMFTGSKPKRNTRKESTIPKEETIFSAENVIGMLSEGWNTCRIHRKYVMHVIEDGEIKTIHAPMITRIGIIDIRELGKDFENDFYRNYLRAISSRHDDYPNPYYEEY